MSPGIFALVLLLPTLAAADNGRDAAFGSAELVAAIKRHDWRTISARIATPITYSGMWLPDAACKRFRTGGVVKDKDRDPLAKCLARLSLQLSTRRTAIADSIVLTALPGLEIELAFDGSSLRWIGPAGSPHDDEGLPLLTAQTFEALRTQGSTLVDDKVAPELAGLVGENGKPRVVNAWMKTCLDAKGAITKRQVVTTQGTKIGAAFERATSDWAFKPFAPRGVATPACSLTLLSYPAARAPSIEELPVSGAPPRRRDVMDLDDLWLSP